MIAYGRSKTANALLAAEFDKRHRRRGVAACSVVPGAIRTELGRHMSAELMEKLWESPKADAAARGKPLLEFKTVEQGARTAVWAAAVADGELTGGKYCENCQVAEIMDSDVLDANGVRSYALDPVNAANLWTKSEKLVGERF